MFSNLMTCWGANNAHPSSVNTPNMNDIFPKPPLKRGSANIKLSSPAVEFWHHFHEEWQALQLDGRLVVESASRHSNPVSPVSAVAHNPKDDNVAADWHIALREAVQQQPAFPLEAGRVRKILERFGWSIEELPSAVSSRIAASLIHALLHVDRSLYELQHQQSLASSATVAHNVTAVVPHQPRSFEPQSQSEYN
eukprot:Platyproteum_vivax@DN7691_c3_g2_i9.p1